MYFLCLVVCNNEYYFFQKNICLALFAIDNLSHVLLNSNSIHVINVQELFVSIHIQFDACTSSGVAQPLYPITGIPKQRASAVAIQKLSFAILIIHVASFNIAIFSCTLVMCPTKIIVGHAILFAYCISGQSPITINGVLVWLHASITVPISLTYFCTLHTNTRYGFGVVDIGSCKNIVSR